MSGTHSCLSYDDPEARWVYQESVSWRAVRYHHENYDGTGYPDNLAGEDIPYMARESCGSATSLRR